jgi:two-component system, OmpR family, response regulator
MSSQLRHILCVDDEEDILEITKLSLESIGGFQVTCNRGGAGIVSTVERVRPDLILLDVMMADVDGPSTLKAIRCAPHLVNIPVVFLTARANPSEVREYLNLGATGVLTKPFDPMAISEQILKIWKNYQIETQQPA